MKKTSVEMAVGIFVVIGLACVGYLTIKLGRMELIGDNLAHLPSKQTVAGSSPVSRSMLGSGPGQVCVAGAVDYGPDGHSETWCLQKGVPP